MSFIAFQLLTTARRLATKTGGGSALTLTSVERYRARPARP
jgi:hypothetical protein